VQDGSIVQGRFRLERLLGRGGMADVYLAFDLRRQVYVAVKALREDLAEDPEFVGRFQREAEALARLDHPFIVRFYSFERQGSAAFIVMDYVSGATLRTRLAQVEGPLPLEEVTAVLRYVGSALQYAHNEGYIHRDIKPGNIMLREDGTILLSDFGIARAAEATTMTMGPLGTPAYMSPEQILGQQASPQTDIYCLGVVLYEAVTGRRPFSGESGTGTGTTERVRQEHLHAVPLDPKVYNRAVSPEVSSIILRALAKDPAQRWPDVTSMVQAWEAAMGLEHESFEALRRRGPTVVPRSPSLAAAPRAAQPEWPQAPVYQASPPVQDVPRTPQWPPDVLSGPPPAVVRQRKSPSWLLAAAAAVVVLLLAVVTVAMVALIRARQGAAEPAATVALADATASPTAPGNDATAEPSATASPEPTPTVDLAALYDEAILVAHFDGPEPYNTDFTGDPNASTGQQAIVEGGVIFRPGRFGKGVQIAEGTTNLVLNPSLEVGLAAMDVAGFEVSERAEAPWEGNYGSQVWHGLSASDGDRRVMWSTDALAANTTYTWSLHASGSGRVLVYLYDGAQVFAEETITLGSAMVRFTGTGKSSSSATFGGLYIRVTDVGSPVEIWCDGLQVEARSYATPYADGSLGPGHAWLGEPHASASSRGGGALSYPESGLNPEGGTIALWVGKADWVYRHEEEWVAVQDAGDERLEFFRGTDGWAFRAVSLAGADVGSALAPQDYEFASGWHQFVLVWGTEAGAVYLDGELWAHVGGMSGGLAYERAVHQLLIGSYGGVSRVANATFDELVIWGRALSDDEIRVLYTGNASVGP